MTTKENLRSVQFGNYNRKTDVWVAGMGSPRTGDKSVDGSWIFFEVTADSQESAEIEVRRYVASPKAKFTGKQVTLVDGVAHPGNTGDSENSIRF